MDITPIIEFLRTRIGLNVESIGAQALEKVVRDCMAECGSVCIDEYIQTLLCLPNEVDRLVESVVIPETYFFRDKELFTGLGNYLRQFWLDKKTNAPLRILSVPCSTGEEPYSIAMLLFDMNIGRGRFHIDAVDISMQAINAARRGIYTAYSFRGTDPSLRERYFLKGAEGYALKKEVSSAVDFQQGNILACDFASMRAGYDVIFCRNMLIYFDNAAKNRVVSVLTQLLNRDGALFVGHAETARLSAGGFSRLAFPRSFTYCRGGYIEQACVDTNASAHQEKMPEARVSGHAHKITPVPKKPESGVKTAGFAQIHKQDGAKSHANAAENIAEAYSLIGAGEVDRAAKICEELVAHDSYSAQAYYLLGQVVDSTGDGYLAEEYLKKAVYLDPNFYDALICLANLCERLGDKKNAARFRDRAGRVIKRASGNSITPP